MDEWVNVWGVLKEDRLYMYSSPIDEEAMDCLDVRDWELKQTRTMDASRRPHVITLSHQKFESELLAVDSHDELEHWSRQLGDAIGYRHQHAHKTVHSDSSSDSESMSSEQSREEDEAERCRQTLLRELMRHRNAAQQSLHDRQAKRQECSSVDTDLGSEGTEGRSDDFVMVDEEQNYKDMTHLMQRKVSMQFKLDYVQKHLDSRRKAQQPKTKKFRLLSFHKASKNTETKAVTPEEEALSVKVQDLSSRLSGIEMDIEEKKQQMRSSQSSSSLEQSPPGSANKPSVSPTSSLRSLRNRKLGFGLNPNFSFSSADVKQIRTDTLSRQQRDRIKAVNKTNHRHSWTPDMRKSFSAQTLSKTWSNQTLSQVIHEEPNLHSAASLTPPSSLNRLFSRDASEPNSAEADLSNNSPDFFGRKRAMFSLSSGESCDEPLDTPMKDMVLRNNNNSERTYASSEKGQWCYVCLCHPSEAPVSGEGVASTSAISDLAQAHITDFEDFIQIKLGSMS